MFRHLPLTGYGVAGGRRDCPLCGSDEFSELSDWDRRLKRLRHVTCSGCGLVRQDPLPSEASLAAYYATAYRRDYQGALSGPSRRHRRKRLREGRRRLEKLTPLLAGCVRIRQIRGSHGVPCLRAPSGSALGAGTHDRVVGPRWPDLSRNAEYRKRAYRERIRRPALRPHAWLHQGNPGGFPRSPS